MSREKDHVPTESRFATAHPTGERPHAADRDETRRRQGPRGPGLRPQQQNRGREHSEIGELRNTQIEFPQTRLARFDSIDALLSQGVRLVTTPRTIVVSIDEMRIPPSGPLNDGRQVLNGRDCRHVVSTSSRLINWRAQPERRRSSDFLIGPCG